MRLALALVGVTTALVVSTALAATMKFKPGKVLETHATVSFKGPWYVYNKSACRFRVTAKHPKAYVSQLRRQPGMRLAYSPEGTQTAFDKTLNDVTRRAAVKAGMKFFQFSNEYPSTTLPLQAADQAKTVKADVVISANVQPDLYPAIQKKYEQSCIPFLDEYKVPGTKNVPAFQADNFLTGAVMAAAAAKIIKKRGWPVKQTWVVTCQDPNNTTQPGTVYDILRGYRQTLAKQLGIPNDHIAAPDLVCDFKLGAEGARQAVADWLTAHPDAKYVTVGTYIDDIYGQGAANALRQAGFGSRGLVVGRGGGEASLKLIASNDPIFAVDGNPVFTGWGSPIVAMAQAIALGRPVPALVSPPVVAVTKENVDKYLP